MLIGREAEINLLNTYLKRPNNQVLVMYGLDGVGKSSIVNLTYHIISKTDKRIDYEEFLERLNIDTMKEIELAVENLRKGIVYD